MLSFSLSFGSALGLASTVVNGMLPVYLVPLGVGLGLMILAALMKAMSGLKKVNRY